jgi:branched-chain amino acid transport system ATP-binding protein
VGQAPLTEEHEITRALSHFGLLDLCGAIGGSLSLFERRMLELAKTLVGAPKLLLLDEPAADLSDAETGRLSRAIRSIAERFAGQVPLIDHDREFVETLCGQTLVLDFGGLLAWRSSD